MLAVQEYLGALTWAFTTGGVPAGISSPGANVTVPTTAGKMQLSNNQGEAWIKQGFTSHSRATRTVASVGGGWGREQRELGFWLYWSPRVGGEERTRAGRDR